MARIKGPRGGKGKGEADKVPVARAVNVTEGEVAFAQGTANFGATKVVQLGDDDKARLHVRYAPFKVEIVDIDVILIFEDGSKIVIPGMALAVFSGRKAHLVFDDKDVLAEDAIAGVGEIREQTVPLKIALSSANSDISNESKSDGQ